jgi:hypothetical protein
MQAVAAAAAFLDQHSRSRLGMEGSLAATVLLVMFCCFSSWEKKHQLAARGLGVLLGWCFGDGLVRHN